MAVAFLVVGVILVPLGVFAAVFPTRILSLDQRLLRRSYEEVAHAVVFSKPTYLWTTRLSGVVAVVVGLAFVAGYFLGGD